ncbi:LysR family transcriptional regulator [Lactobacillus corticis]|uniref:LysR family transcriptional regulator n=1 Tax=Lactobacillus corticis TaxID=2201249 RepID=A0A916QHH4_9LACO|nr:LysR family transcriptional regulator [Lactobacillus corticis]GFZ27476.1 LysR family transcriptional regulator [Lactobacillus corticis]
MNLNQLYYFRELAEQQQYTRAAELLYISQPTLSVSIKQLESELNCKLFRHNGHNVELTPYGRLFYSTVVKTLDVLDDGKRRLEQQISQDQGNIHVACIPTHVGTLLPRLVKEYKQETETAPRIIYHDNPSLQICQGIQNGWYDIGITSYVEGFDNFNFIPFFYEPVIAIVSPDSDLAKIDRISPEELRGENLLTYTKEIEIGQSITNALLAKASDLKIENRLHDELAIAGQVMTNNIVGVVADTVYLKGFDLHRIKLDLPKDTRQIYLAYDSERSMSPEFCNFLDFLKRQKHHLTEHFPMEPIEDIE